jgi:hypothetical protein
MADSRGRSHFAGKLGHAVLWLVCVVWLPARGSGQAVSAPGAPEVGAEATSDHARELALPTLHVYTNLIQIPVLVLNDQRTSLSRIAEDRFSVSLDSGPKFKPTHVRDEGDDPITLAILLDPTGTAEELTSSMKDQLAKLAPMDLNPRDHVSVYVMSCKLMRTALDVQASRLNLQLATEHAWTEGQRLRGRHGCHQDVGLWDSMAMAGHEMSRLPGRRVMLVVTDGVDRSSQTRWVDVRTYLQARGIAAFGLSGMESPWSSVGRPGGGRGGITASSVGSMAGGVALGGKEDHFNEVCELTGGMRMFTKAMDLGAELKRLTKILRERYIVEFPRPLKQVAGDHEIEVAISKMKGFIRPAGVSVPIADPKIAADPLTLPPDPTKAPEFGERRVLVPKQ